MKVIHPNTCERVINYRLKSLWIFLFFLVFTELCISNACIRASYLWTRTAVPATRREWERESCLAVLGACSKFCQYAVRWPRVAPFANSVAVGPSNLILAILCNSDRTCPCGQYIAQPVHFVMQHTSYISCYMFRHRGAIFRELSTCWPVQRCCYNYLMMALGAEICSN
jgi:hypothetical protein